MASGGLFLFLINYFAFKGVTSKPVNDISYIEGINFQYENDNWICGDVECPTNTFGCKIVIKTSAEDRNVLFQTFNCIDEDKNVILGAGDRIELTKIKIIDIEIESYVGAESDYSTGYGSGYENAKGVIAVDKLPHFKEIDRLNKQIIEDLNP